MPRPTLRWVALGCAALAVATVLAAYLTWPYGWDQGVYSWVAATIREGGQPYVDAWDVKGPAVFYLTALGQALTGATPLGLRVFDLLLLSGALFVVAALARTWAPGRAQAMIAPVILSIWYFSLRYWHTAQPEGWISWLIAAAVLLTLGSPSWRPIRLVVAGMLIGVAFLAKQPYGLFGIPLLVAIAGFRSDRRGAAVGDATLAVAGGVVLVAAAFLYFDRAGILPELWEAHYRYAAQYSGVPGSRLRGVLAGIVTIATRTEVIPPLIPFAVLGWYHLRILEKKSLSRTLVSWSFTSVLVVLLQNRYYDYHFLVLMPPLCLLAGAGIARCWTEATRNQPGPGRSGAALLGVGLGALLVIHTIPFIALETGRWLAWVTHRVPRQAYLDGFGAPGAEHRTAEFLRNNSRPEDRILMWGCSTGVLVMANRQSFTRFGCNLALLSQPSPVVKRYDKEFRARFEVDRPRFILLGQQHEDVRRAPPRPLDAWVRSVIASEYRMRLDTRLIQVYERAAGPPGVGSSPMSAPRFPALENPRARVRKS